MKTDLFLLAYTGQAKSLCERDCLPNDWWREKRGTAKFVEAGYLRVDSKINAKLGPRFPILLKSSPTTKTILLVQQTGIIQGWVLSAQGL